VSLTEGRITEDDDATEDDGITEDDTITGPVA
jgi:hypothetical protein